MFRSKLAATIWRRRVVAVPPCQSVQLEVHWPDLLPGLYAVGVSAEELPNNDPASIFGEVFSYALRSCRGAFGRGHRADSSGGLEAVHTFGA